MKERCQRNRYRGTRRELIGHQRPIRNKESGFGDGVICAADLRIGTLGSGYPFRAADYGLLADIVQRRGDIAGAIALLRRALRHAADHLPPGHLMREGLEESLDVALRQA